MSNTPEFATLCQRAGMALTELVDKLGFSERTALRWEKGKASARKSTTIILRNLSRQRQKYSRMDSRAPFGAFRYIELFAGIGGFRREFDALGGKYDFTSQWDKYAVQIYRANCHDHDDHIIAGDITKVKASSNPEHDLLLAGFPCQPLSIVGVSKKNTIGQEQGFRCKRQGNLFLDIVRILRFHRPRVFVLENVKNLADHDTGNTFRIIRHNLEKVLGYRIITRISDAMSFVPQAQGAHLHRRVPGRTGFTLDNLHPPNPEMGAKLRLIPHMGDGLELMLDNYYMDTKRRVRSKYALKDYLWEYLQCYAERHRRRGNGFGFTVNGPDGVARTNSARHYEDGVEVLVLRRSRSPRRLTLRECLRLLGLDRPGEASFRNPVSDVQAGAHAIQQCDGDSGCRGNGAASLTPFSGRRGAKILYRTQAGDRVDVPDVVDGSTWSRTTSGIRRKDAKPKTAIRSGFPGRGVHGRRHDAKLSGGLDTVLRGHGAVTLFKAVSGTAMDVRRSGGLQRVLNGGGMQIEGNLARCGWAQAEQKNPGGRCAYVWECALGGGQCGDPGFAVEGIVGWIESDRRALTVRGTA